MPSCSWGSCGSISSYECQDERPQSDVFEIQFFQFPSPQTNLESCKAWIKACGQKNLSIFNITNNLHICSKHFVDGKPTEANPDPELCSNHHTLSTQLDCLDGPSTLSLQEEEVFPEMLQIHKGVEGSDLTSISEPGVSEIIENIGPTCIKEEVIDANSLLTQDLICAKPSNNSNEIKGFEMSVHQGYSIVDLQKLNGPSLLKLFALCELLPSGLYKFSCHIYPWGCTRSHVTENVNEGKDLIIAHLLNHVESFRTRMKKDPSLEFKRFFPYVHIKIEPDLIDVDNPFPDNQEEVTDVMDSTSPHISPSPDPTDLHAVEASDFSACGVTTPMVRDVVQFENTPSYWLEAAPNTTLLVRTSTRIAKKALLKKQQKEEKEKTKKAASKVAKVVLHDMNSRKRGKKDTFDNDYKKKGAQLKSKRTHFRPPKTYTNYALDDSSSESDSSESDHSQSANTKRKMIFRRNHTLASTLRNRNHLYVSKISRRKKKSRDGGADTSDSSSDNSYKRVKRPSQKPTNVVFKICNDGSLAIENSDKEKNVERNDQEKLKPCLDTKNDENHNTVVATDLETAAKASAAVNQNPITDSIQKDINEDYTKFSTVTNRNLITDSAIASKDPTQYSGAVDPKLVTDFTTLNNQPSKTLAVSSRGRMKNVVPTYGLPIQNASNVINEQYLEDMSDIAPPEPPDFTHCDLTVTEEPASSTTFLHKNPTESRNVSDFDKLAPVKKPRGPRILMRSSFPPSRDGKDSTPSCSTNTLKETDEGLLESLLESENNASDNSCDEARESAHPYSSTHNPLLKKKKSRKQNLAENVKQDNEFEAAEKALLGIWNDHCYIKTEYPATSKRAENGLSYDIIDDGALDQTLGFPGKRYASWLGNSINSLLDTHKKIDELNKPKDSEETQYHLVGSSSRKIEAASDPKIKAKALRLISELRHRKPKEVMVCTVRVVDNSRSSYVVQDFYTCEICGKRFTAPNSLYGHYRGHAGIKPFRCDICGQTFTRSHSLSYHSMIHNNTSRFKCKYCGKKFRHPTHYKEHLNRHTGLEPYKCTDCHRRFRTRNTFRRHAISKHNKVLTPMGSYSVNSKVLQTITWDK